MANHGDCSRPRRNQRDDDRDRASPGRADGGECDGADDACVIVAWADLTPADYEVMWRQTEAFKDVAREVRAIVRGDYPDMT